MKKSVMKTLKFRLKLEEERLKNQNAVVVFEKSILIYVFCLFIAIVGFINSFMNITMLYSMILMGMVFLIIGLIPYIKTAVESTSSINNMINELSQEKND